ncbi:MAG: hypothetical protein AAGM22_09970 [Acidobacteriota bacterium]
MGSLVEDALAVTFVVPDDTGFFSIEDEAVQRVQDLVERTLLFLREVTEIYDEESHDPELAAEAGEDETGEDDFLREIGAAISSELAAREVSSLAFATRTQLKENRDALVTAIEHRNIWVVASHADTGLRRVCKGLITVEAAAREYENFEPLERHWSDIKDSLETRRLYGQFRRALNRQGEPADAAEVADRLRKAAHRITILRDRKIYPFLRVYDRVPIRRLQKRIGAWLDRPDDESGKEADGRHLLSDLHSFAELLKQINNREDLREHDRRTAMRLFRVFFSSKNPPTELGPGHVGDLELLLGRDDELDQIVLDPLRHGIEPLREPLERLLDQLNKPFGAVEEKLSPFTEG